MLSSSSHSQPRAWLHYKHTVLAEVRTLPAPSFRRAERTPSWRSFPEAGDSASIVTDGLGNPYGTSLDLTNYGNPDFVGCPPAGQPVIGGLPQCGDITMSVSLDPGTYTVVLSDGQYIANAVFDDGTLGEGFSDLTGGAFCNLSINGVDCPNTSGAYALDITTPGSTSAVPEPAGSALAVTVLFGIAWFYRRKRTASSAPQQ